MILATVSSAALEGRFRFEVAWDLNYEDTARLRGVGPDQQCLAVIDFADPARAIPAARIANGRPQLMAIAVGCGASREELLEMMQAGIRDVLPNFVHSDLRNAAERAVANLAAASEKAGDVYAFLPAKPGCGASTIATQATGQAARLSQDPVLLMDTDVRLGITSFLLKASSSCHIMDALDHAERLDWDLWSSMISQLGHLHLLGSGAADVSRHFSGDRLGLLLDFAVRQYSSISVDLPGLMEDFECDVLLRAKRIFLVTSADVSALHIARRKSAWLRDLKLTNNISVVLNCVERRSTLSVEDIERIIDLPVRYMLPSSAGEISKAVQRGVILEGDSPLGKQIAKIAADLIPSAPVITKRNPVRRFVEYFSISNARQIPAGGWKQ